MTRSSDIPLELEGHIHQQAPQSETIEDLQLYFNLNNNYNNACAMARAKKQDVIRKDIKYVLEEILLLTKEETRCKIFSIEAQKGADDIFFYPKRRFMTFSARTRMVMLFI